MNDVAEPAGLARDKAFADALDVLQQRRDEFRAQGFVPKDYVHLLKKAGLYRASTPVRFGGEPMPPAQFLDRIEQISAVDPSTGWVASFGSALVYFGALPLQTQAEIYADGPDVCYAGGHFPMQEAQVVPGGYLCTGTWLFVSGCAGADWLGVGLKGGPEAAGRPVTAILRPEQAQIVVNWDVAGMKATGSNEIRLDKVFVPEEHTFIRGGDSLVDEPLNRYPMVGYAAQVLTAVAVGAARGAIDFLIESGSVTSSITGGAQRAQRPSYQAGVAGAIAEWRAARAFFYEATEEVWALAQAGDEITPQAAATLRLATTHAAHQSRTVVLRAFDLAGTGAIYNSHPLQRFLQDGMVPAQHAMMASNLYEASGAVLLGADPKVPSFP